MAEDRRQRAEDGKQKTEGRRQNKGKRQNMSAYELVPSIVGG